MQVDIQFCHLTVTDAMILEYIGQEWFLTKNEKKWEHLKNGPTIYRHAGKHKYS